MALLVFNWIRPENIAEKAYSWGFTEALEVFQVSEGAEFWRNSTVESKELIIDEAGDGKSIKSLHEKVVDFFIIFVKCFSSEIEEGCHLTALVIASQHVDRRRKIQL